MAPLIQAAGFLLFCQRTPASFLLMQHANRWDLPKGHAEAGEPILETALRETEEETGIAAENIVVDRDFQFIIEYPVTGGKRGDYLKRVTYFLGYVDRLHTPRLTEHIGFEWCQWPPSASIQNSTIDPLLAEVARHFQNYPARLHDYS